MVEDDNDGRMGQVRTAGELRITIATEDSQE